MILLSVDGNRTEYVQYNDFVIYFFVCSFDYNADPFVHAAAAAPRGMDGRFVQSAI